jgi:CAI-1 autoinducer synthase
MIDVVNRRVDRFYRERVDEAWEGEIITRGRRPIPGDLLLNHNDYLSIGRHPDIARSVAHAILEHGSGLVMSAVFETDHSLQRDLERALACYMGVEDVVLCQSGYAANVGLLQSIAAPGDPVFIDMLAHASLWEGIRSAGAEAVPFRHNDWEHLERLMRRHRPGVVLVDTLYSTTGDLCPLEDVTALAEYYGSVVVADESHAIGVCGQRGAGLVPLAGLSARVHFRTASLAKAFVGRAGYIGCNRRFADYFRHEARPAIFSSCLLPHELAGLMTTLSLIKGADAARARLQAVARSVRAGLAALGYPVDAAGSQIVPLEAGSEGQTLKLRKILEREGIIGAVFCAPATPANRSMVRLSLHAGMSEADIGRLLSVCARIRDECELTTWRSVWRRREMQVKASATAAEIAA